MYSRYKSNTAELPVTMAAETPKPLKDLKIEFSKVGTN